MTYSHAQHILAAFCYVTAMMIWAIGQKMMYCGQASLWFVVLIVSLVVASGLSFDFDGVFKSGGGDAV